jgi:hypothetical protein
LYFGRVKKIKKCISKIDLLSQLSEQRTPASSFPSKHACSAMSAWAVLSLELRWERVPEHRAHSLTHAINGAQLPIPAGSGASLSHCPCRSIEHSAPSARRRVTALALCSTPSPLRARSRCPVLSRGRAVESTEGGYPLADAPSKCWATQTVSTPDCCANWNPSLYANASIIKAPLAMLYRTARPSRIDHHDLVRPHLEALAAKNTPCIMYPFQCSVVMLTGSAT